MQFPITIGLCRSRFLGGVIGGFFALILVSAGAGPFPLPIKAGMLLFGLAGTLLAWRNARPVIIEVHLIDPRRMVVLLAGETIFQEALPAGPAWVHPWLTVARLALPAASRTVCLVVFPDSASTDARRRLRVFLRWRREQPAGAPGPTP